MTDRAQLLQAALTSADDAPRLVYADWLEEQGDLARAELIRAQCRLARQPPWERDAVAAAWEAEALLAAHGARFRDELPVLEGVAWTDFERGFPATARVRDAQTLERHAAAIAATGVHRVELSVLDETDVRWPDGGLPWLRALRLAGPGEHAPHEAGSLLAMPRELEVIGLGDYDELAWFDRRGDAPLTRLRVQGNHTIGRPFAEQLAASKAVASLERLELGTAFVDHDSGYFSDPTLRAEGARILAGARLGHLIALELDRQRIGVPGLEALLGALPRLRELSARGCELTDLGPLAHSQGAPLARLDLGENELGAAGVRVLAGAPRTAAIEALALDTCELDGDGLAALAAAPCWSTLRTLELSRNPLGAAGVVALVAAAPPARLHTLRLADADLDDAAAAALLAEIAWLPSLLELDASDNRLGRGASALAAHLAGGGVRRLRLARVGLDANHAGSLAPLLPQLVHLELDGNHLGDLGAAALADGAAPRLCTLSLRSCGLTSKGIAALCRADLPRLHTLLLDQNSVGRHGMKLLLASPLAGRLARLELRNSALDNAAAAALADSPALGRLRVLDLRHNTAVKADGLVALARSPHLRGVTHIRLSGYPWDYSKPIQALLAERFGPAWNYQPDDAE